MSLRLGKDPPPALTGGRKWSAVAGSWQSRAGWARTALLPATDGEWGIPSSKPSPRIDMAGAGAREAEWAAPSPHNLPGHSEPVGPPKVAPTAPASQTLGGGERQGGCVGHPNG
ncbi:hypothetical protein KIL84_015477 [Mauremys mutica]|uniref:Uncharacterized protein n=1 Tax=Mauremys mutica TaxID=74926 RepID=A0A9D4AS20_9SAUR|nr:hypothetical protein KIL84_015477 [Mauremys mutica]